MNCVNCGCRLTFFNETDELWAGTERVFCISCRKMIDPFLEEGCESTHAEHLHSRKAALNARGLTPEGYAHLEEYCRHLDELTPVKPGGESARKEKKAARSPLRAIRESIMEDDYVEPLYPVSADDTSREMLNLQRQSNQLLRSDMRELAATYSETTRLFSDKIERLQERLRLLTYLAAAGAGTGLLSALMVVLLMILK